MTEKPIDIAVEAIPVQGPKSHALLAPLVADGALDDLDDFAFSTGAPPAPRAPSNPLSPSRTSFPRRARLLRLV